MLVRRARRRVTVDQPARAGGTRPGARRGHHWHHADQLVAHLSDGHRHRGGRGQGVGAAAGGADGSRPGSAASAPARVPGLNMAPSTSPTPRPRSTPASRTPTARRSAGRRCARPGTASTSPLSTVRQLVHPLRAARAHHTSRRTSLGALRRSPPDRAGQPAGPTLVAAIAGGRRRGCTAARWPAPATRRALPRRALGPAEPRSRAARVRHRGQPLRAGARDAAAGPGRLAGVLLAGLLPEHINVDAFRERVVAAWRASSRRMRVGDGGPRRARRRRQHLPGAPAGDPAAAGVLLDYAGITRVIAGRDGGALSGRSTRSPRRRPARRRSRPVPLSPFR